MWKKYYFICTCVAIIFGSCGQFTSFPKNVEDAIGMADDNWEEIFGVMQHYREKGDSVRLKAAEFIIGNMTGKYWSTSTTLC